MTAGVITAGLGQGAEAIGHAIVSRKEETGMGNEATAIGIMILCIITHEVIDTRIAITECIGLTPVFSCHVIPSEARPQSHNMRSVLKLVDID